MEQSPKKRTIQMESNTFQSDPQPSRFQIKHQKQSFKNKQFRLSLENRSFLEKYKKNMPQSQIDEFGLNLPNQDFTGDEMRKEIKKMMINSRHEDQYFKQNYDIKANQNDLDFPKAFRIQNDSVQDSVYQLRNDLRINRFDHTKFDPTLMSIDAKKYFKGIYDPNTPIENEELLKSFGQFVKERGNDKIGIVKLYELFASIQNSSFKLDKKVDEKKVIRDRINKEYPKVTTEQFIELMAEMRYQNNGRPLDMKKEDEILRYTAKKMQDFAPYNPQNFKAKLKILKDLVDDGYELEVISPKKLRKMKEQELLKQKEEELKLQQIKDSQDLESIQEINEAPLITNNDEVEEKLQKSRESINSHMSISVQSADTKTNEINGTERNAVRDLKDESVQQSSQINNSTLVGTNYNQVQYIDSAGVMEAKSTIPTNQPRDGEYFSGFDDNDVASDYGETDTNLTAGINRDSERQLFRHENSQEFLMVDQQPIQEGLRNQTDMRNGPHFQSQVFVQNQSFLSHQSIKLKNGQKILSDIKKDQGRYPPAMNLNDSSNDDRSPIRNNSFESELNRSSKFYGRYQQDRFQTHQSRLDRNELPSINRNGLQLELNDYSQNKNESQIHTNFFIPDNFSQLGESQHSILPNINAISRSRQQNLNQSTTFPKIMQNQNKSVIKSLKEQVRRNRNDKINKSLNYTPRYLGNINNKPILFVSKQKIKKQVQISPPEQRNRKNSKVDIEEMMKQRKLFSQSQLSPMTTPQNQSPVAIRYQEKRLPKQGINTQTVGHRANNCEQDMAQQTNIQQELTNNSKSKSKTTRRKINMSSVFDQEPTNDITKGSQSVLITLTSPEKIEPFHSNDKNDKRSLSPNQNSKIIQRKRKQFETQKQSLERQSLISILNKCGNPAENDKFSNSIHNQLDKAVDSLNDEIHNIAEVYNSYTDQFDVNHQEESKGSGSFADDKKVDKEIQFEVQPLKNIEEIQEDYNWGKNMDYDLFLSKEAIDQIKRNDGKKKMVRKRNQNDIWKPDRLKVNKVVKDMINSQL